MALARPTDAAEEDGLLARARRNDEAAVRILIQRYNRRLFRLARSILREESEAEDVVQEAYVRAFTRLDEFRGESAFGTWVCRIALNEAMGRMRRRRIARWLSFGDQHISGQVIPFPSANQQQDPERTMAHDEIRLLLEGAIDALPESFRTVFVARLVEGLSVEETADLFGLRPETVKTRLHRARRLLQRRLEDQLGPVLGGAFPFAGARCERLTEAVLRRLKQE
jgi:RNA polymerase sigma-70 factor (ECF subfamily)